MSNKIERMGKYELLSTLGRGGMGIVYKARDTETGLIVALKTILLPHVNVLQSIRREIIGLARLDHVNVVKIVDYGTEHGLHWYAMAFLEGQTLKDYFKVNSSYDDSDLQPIPDSDIDCSDSDLRSTKILKTSVRPYSMSETSDKMTVSPCGESDDSSVVPQSGASSLSFDDCLSYLFDVSAALSYIHGEGIVHRDLKPDNIFLCQNGPAVLIDFGLMVEFSNLTSRDSLSQISYVAGSVHYMAPEQIMNEYVDARADLYSLGCIIYEMLVGQPPFQGVTREDILRSHINRSPIPPQRLQPWIPDDLNELVMKLLAKEPHERCGYADRVGTILHSIFPDHPGYRSGQSPGAYLYRSSFVGRQHHLDTLQSNLSNFKKGKGAIIFVGGESGVGKTRLLLEFERKLKRLELPIITGECRGENIYPLEAFRGPLQFIADLCHEGGAEKTAAVLGKNVKLLSNYQPALRAVPGYETYPNPPALSIEESLTRLYQAILETMGNLSSENGVVLLLDDLQWADEMTLQAIEYFIEKDAFDRYPFMIVATYREEELNEDLQQLMEKPPCQVLTMTRLSLPAVITIIDEMLAISGAPMNFSRYLASASEGNPFFIAEYLRMAIEADILNRDSIGKWQVRDPEGDERAITDFDMLPIPRNIRELLLSRYSQLSSQARLIADKIATYGRKIDTSLAHKLSNNAEDLFFTTLTELIRKNIFETPHGGEIKFTHDKIREIIYENLAGQKRIEYHEDIAEQIKNHFSESLDDWYETLGFHYESAGNRKEALFAYKKAAQIMRKSGGNIEAIKNFQKALNVFSDTDEDDALIEIIYNLAVIYYEIGDYAKAIPYLEKAQPLYGQGKDQDGYGNILMYIGMIYLKRGDLVKAENYHMQALEISEKTGDLVNQGIHLNNLGRVYLRLGQYTQAIQKLSRSLELKKKAKNVYGEGFSLYFLGLVQYYLGNFLPAQEYLDESCRLWSTVSQNQRVLAYFHFGKGVVLRALKQYKRAEEHLLKAQDINSTLMLRAELIETLSELSVLKMKMGQKEEALYLSRKVCSLFESHREIEDIQRVYFNIYIVLRALREKTASDYLQKAFDSLMNMCRSIPNLESRNTFLSAISINKKIMKHAAKNGLTADSETVI